MTNEPRSPCSGRGAGRALATALGLSATLACSLPAPPHHLPESVHWLQEYLRFDTSNPPGNERPAVDYLAGILREAGAEVEVLTRPTGRASLWAAVGPPGADTLLLLSHVDVVPAGDGWSVPPFAGLLHDGEIWGRGAIDAKGLGVAHLAALAALARSPEPLGRRVALFAAADEELGGGQGLAWWLDDRPDLFARVRGALAAGGHNRVGLEAVAWWGIEVAQKEPLWLEACAATPEELVRSLARGLERPLVWRVSEPVRAFFRALRDLDPNGGGRGFDPDRAIAPEGPLEPLRPGMQNFFLDSLQVNELERGSEASCATLDARLLPETDAEAFLARVRAALGPAIEVRVLLAGPAAPPSPVEDPLYRLLARELAPVAPAVPSFIAGITDARYLRARGIPVYGFSPFLLDGEHARSVHSADERIPLAELAAGVERMTRIVEAWACGPR